MTLIVFDFETTSADPLTAQPVQLAAIPINSLTLKIQNDKIFSSRIKPDDMTNYDPATLEWHAKIRNVPNDTILAEWDSSPPLKQVWQSFLDYLQEFNFKKTKWTAPVPVGHNILRFDLPIADRIHEKYGYGRPLFHPRDVIDTLHYCFAWFESLKEPKSYSMDNLRVFFGMSDESRANAHDAVQDVKDVAELAIRFLNLHRKTASKTRFKGAFSNDSSNVEATIM